jgi:hypothetical protein
MSSSAHTKPNECIRTNDVEFLFAAARSHKVQVVLKSPMSVSGRIRTVLDNDNNLLRTELQINSSLPKLARDLLVLEFLIVLASLSPRQRVFPRRREAYERFQRKCAGTAAQAAKKIHISHYVQVSEFFKKLIPASAAA